MLSKYRFVRRLILHFKNSDSFASHFATFFNTESKPTPTLLRQKMTFSILWQGNPLSVQKSFGTKNCRLCIKESTHILKNLHTNPTKLINHNSEIYTSCHHKTRFHRFPKINNGTDESCTGRKSVDGTVVIPLVCRATSPTNPVRQMINLYFFMCFAGNTISIYRSKKIEEKKPFYVF